LGIAEFNADANNRQVRVQLINTTDAVVYGEQLQQTNNSTNYFGFAALGYVSMTGTNKTFEIQYSRVTAGATCTIRNARIEFHRVQ
jgi:hypothetical protein